MISDWMSLAVIVSFPVTFISQLKRSSIFRLRLYMASFSRSPVSDSASSFVSAQESQLPSKWTIFSSNLSMSFSGSPSVSSGAVVSSPVLSGAEVELSFPSPPEPQENAESMRAAVIASVRYFFMVILLFLVYLRITLICAAIIIIP